MKCSAAYAWEVIPTKRTHGHKQSGSDSRIQQTRGKGEGGKDADEAYLDVQPFYVGNQEKEEVFS